MKRIVFFRSLLPADFDCGQQRRLAKPEFDADLFFGDGLWWLKSEWQNCI